MSIDEGLRQSTVVLLFQLDSVRHNFILMLSIVLCFVKDTGLLLFFIKKRVRFHVEIGR